MSARAIRRILPVVALGALTLAPNAASALGCTPNIICPPSARTVEVGPQGAGMLGCVPGMPICPPGR